MSNLKNRVHKNSNFAREVVIVSDPSSCDGFNNLFACVGVSSADQRFYSNKGYFRLNTILCHRPRKKEAFRLSLLVAHLFFSQLPRIPPNCYTHRERERAREPNFLMSRKRLASALLTKSLFFNPLNRCRVFRSTKVHAVTHSYCWRFIRKDEY